MIVTGQEDTEYREAQLVSDMMNFIRTLENDNKGIPAWLWEERERLIAEMDAIRRLYRPRTAEEIEHDSRNV